MKLFLRLLKFMSPWQVALAILLGCATVASNIGLLSMAAYLIAAAAIVPFLFLLTLPIYIVRVMGVSRAVSRYGERLVAHNVTFRLLAQLRTWVYGRLEPLAPARLLAYRSGDVLARLVADVEELQHVYLRVVSPLIVAVVIAILTFGLFSIFSPVLAWTALAFLVATGLGAPLLAGVLTRGLGKRQLALRAELNAQIVDGIQGVQDLLACGRAGDQQRKIADLDRALGQVQRQMALIAGLQQTMNDFLMNLALLTILVLAIPLVATKAIDGVYLAFLALAILASFEAIQPLAQAFQFLGHSLAAAERLFGVTDAAPQVLESAAPLPGPSGRTLEFDDVHFAYHLDVGTNPSLQRHSEASAAHSGGMQGEGEVLRGITFTVRPGRRVAVVGPSGSGKSTLVRLALRFWDPTEGAIRLDGQDIRKYALSDLRSVIGTVAQDTHLFNGTIRDNLLLARPEASDSEMKQVLEEAQLTEFINQLPGGLETWVGEQGLRLSGGERQRLAIARALLKNAPLLILDEATANLDLLTESALLDALDVLMRGRTTLMITHRLVAMERMDEILVLDSGEVCQRGSHSELLAVPGLYRQMLDVQNGMLALP
ncbi:MAG: thiol reductant ABC exporter subunit CydC [Ktedonobacteraceae bacterium]